ncbi:hypothetical protein BS47DRAFT_1306328 [Hydnum rufescens UP504]|uniref:Uncharacterized protein n=1 Tax=Hydnum rufescens UP504 TaxID=1448309 RepID=A0A9P6AIT3_9AGAM|nr:hypothetical protein BS47DRAFT_1306328 [Hydnum rufescens UP504]
MKEFPRFAATCTPFGDLVEQYDQMSGNVLDFSLPYEPSPASSRGVRFDRTNDAVVIVAHVASDVFEHKVSLCSGFAIDVPGHKNSVIVSCAHTLEMMRSNDVHKSPSAKSATLIVTPSMQIYPVSAMLSSLPRSDLVLYSLQTSLGSLATLPVNPYPAPAGTSLRAHLVSLGGAPKPGRSWQTWTAGAIQSHWAAGQVLSYRDRAGRESKPGTYDTLAHILYSPIPTPGSSGGPIVDEESGAVIGMVTGHERSNRVEGHRGFGTPAEAIFHVSKSC